MVNGDQYTCLVKGACKARFQTDLGVTETLGCCVGIIIRIDRVIESSSTGMLSVVDLGSRSR